MGEQLWVYLDVLGLTNKISKPHEETVFTCIKVLVDNNSSQIDDVAGIVSVVFQNSD